VDIDATLTGPTWESLALELEKDTIGLPASALQYIRRPVAEGAFNGAGNISGSVLCGLS
jgi:hypothetical protein